MAGHSRDPSFRQRPSTACRLDEPGVNIMASLTPFQVPTLTTFMACNPFSALSAPPTLLQTHDQVSSAGTVTAVIGY